MPVAVDGVIFAVNVTEPPGSEGFCDDEITTEVLATTVIVRFGDVLLASLASPVYIA